MALTLTQTLALTLTLTLTLAPTLTLALTLTPNPDQESGAGGSVLGRQLGRQGSSDSFKSIGPPRTPGRPATRSLVPYLAQLLRC